MLACSVSSYPKHRSSPERGEAGECWESRQRRWKLRKPSSIRCFVQKYFWWSNWIRLVGGRQGILNWCWDFRICAVGHQHLLADQGVDVVLEGRDGAGHLWVEGELCRGGRGFFGLRGDSNKGKTEDCTVYAEEKYDMFNCILTWTTQNASWRADV